METFMLNLAVGVGFTFAILAAGFVFHKIYSFFVKGVKTSNWSDLLVVIAVIFCIALSIAMFSALGKTVLTIFNGG